jgi:hypothetical protein
MLPCLSYPSTLCQIVLDNVALTELSINPLLDCATDIGIIPGLLVYPMCVYPIDLPTSRDNHPLFLILIHISPSHGECYSSVLIIDYMYCAKRLVIQQYQ